MWCLYSCSDNVAGCIERVQQLGNALSNALGHVTRLRKRKSGAAAHAQASTIFRWQSACGVTHSTVSGHLHQSSVENQDNPLVTRHGVDR